MYAAICVYIPVPVPVQWAVIHGTNEKETILHVKINLKKYDILYETLSLRKSDLEIYQIFVPIIISICVFINVIMIGFTFFIDFFREPFISGLIEGYFQCFFFFKSAKIFIGFCRFIVDILNYLQ